MTSCGTSDLSTAATRAPGGPRRSASSSRARLSRLPSASTSTDPSGRLRARPRSPRRSASRHTTQRTPPPSTVPCTRNRVAATNLLRTAARRPARVPPDVHRREDRKDGKQSERRPARVAPGLLVHGAEQHVLLLADEPPDRGEDGTPDEGAEPRERRESRDAHPGDPRRDRDEVTDDREQASHEGADLAVRGEEAFGALEAVRRDPRVPPDAEDHRTPQPVRQAIVRQGSGDAAQDAARDRQDEAHFALGR